MDSFAAGTPPEFGMRGTPAAARLFSMLALALLVALVLGTDDHDLAVAFDNFALVAHRFDRRSDFHFLIPPN